MKFNFLPLTLAAALCVGGFTVTTTRAAEDPAPHRQFGRGALLQRAKEKLNLTDTQVDQIKVVFKAERETLAGLLSRMHEARAGMRTAIQADKADEATVRAAAAKVATVESDLAVERMKLFHQLTPILTDEQRGKLAEFQTQVDNFISSGIERLGQAAGE